ncbi:unnamed protein product [Bursaphelenchus okinawaensis]|uniref:Uncharacterized protein n=1 Tax=Bursaphelenchus okinawaensis TaxID=465554 RepID=A0A811JRL6_9BILA|nr:unnamed protein product [Bursaphelenchus okinawaensis]CAG9079794.1 unnamed protein product [Bursaphelenchus okinawaensis]
MIALVCFIVAACSVYANDVRLRAKRDWFDNIKETASQVGDAVGKAGESVYNGAKDFADRPGEHLQSAGKAIEDGAAKAGDFAVDAGKSAYTATKDLVEHPQDNLEKAGESISQGAQDAANWTGEQAQKGYKAGKDFVNNEENQEAFNKAVDNTTDFFKDMWSQFKVSVDKIFSSSEQQPYGATHEEVSIFTL